MIHMIFEMMKREKEFHGFGYLGHEFRTEKSDKALLKAADEMKLTYAEFFLWCNSRYARHWMDANHDNRYDSGDFKAIIKKDLPGLKEEIGWE